MEWNHGVKSASHVRSPESPQPDCLRGLTICPSLQKPILQDTPVDTSDNQVVTPTDHPEVIFYHPEKTTFNLSITSDYKLIWWLLCKYPPSLLHKDSLLDVFNWGGFNSRFLGLRKVIFLLWRNFFVPHLQLLPLKCWHSSWKNMGRIDCFRLFSDRSFFQGLKFQVCIPLDDGYFFFGCSFFRSIPGSGF